MAETISASPPLIAGFHVEAARARVTESNFLKALIGTALIVAVFSVAYWYERSVLNRHPADIRFIREASEAAMRYITIPHIIIGFLFMWTSPKNRTREKRLWVFGLLLVGAALCTVYGFGGGKANVVLYAGVYLYFLVHEMRDEAMFYTVLGEAPPITDRAAYQNMVRSLVGLTVFFLAAFIWSLVPLGVYQSRGNIGALMAGALPWAVKLPLSLAPMALAIAGYRLALRHYSARLGFPSVAALIRTHAPLFKVIAGVVGVLVAALVITRRPYSLILFHVVAWYIFALHQLKRYPPKTPPTGLWLWMRTTVAGFRTLHIGMVLVLMAIGLVWTIALGQTHYLTWLLAPESFLYWTIMHITVSFVPR